MKRVLLIILITLPWLSYANHQKVNETKNASEDDGSGSFFDRPKVEHCFSQKQPSGWLQNCMENLAKDSKQNYEKQYYAFLSKVESLPHDETYLVNYNKFLSSTKSTKIKWDDFVKDECLNRAYLGWKDSPAFYINESACLSYYYDLRADYYAKYQKIKQLKK